MDGSRGRGAWSVIVAYGCLLAACGSSVQRTGDPRDAGPSGRDLRDDRASDSAGQGGSNEPAPPASSSDPEDMISNPDNPAWGGAGSGPEAWNPADPAGCPDEAPTAGEACVGQIECRYGASAHVACRDLLRCDSGSWVAIDVTLYGRCSESPEGYCPSAPPQGECELSGNRRGWDTCAFDDGTLCTCQTCEDGLCWRCDPPPDTEGCLPVAPNYGDSCEDQGVECAYGDPCMGGDRVICRQATWQPLLPACDT